MTTLLAAIPDSRKRNAHLTFKHNAPLGRHGWLRLTPAYSVQLIRSILSAYQHSTTVLDPFSGTGTTALCASYSGHCGTGLEINPFLVWISSVKFRNFSLSEIENTRLLGATIAEVCSLPTTPASPPPIHNISRWWNENELLFLCRLKAHIFNMSEVGSVGRELLVVALCRTIIALSNAAFNHQSMSFKEKDQRPRLFDVDQDGSEIFKKELGFVLDGATDNPPIEPRVVSGDARQTSSYLKDRYELLITSPPYPNRISYIRELRPYMYWLEFLKNGRDAGEYDWQAIGGTWGIATSRLAEWMPSGRAFVPAPLRKALMEINRHQNRHGRILANYVAKYFEDIWQHLSDVTVVLEQDAEVHYIVGNSTFYGTLLPVEEIYAEMLQEVGFRNVEIVRIRKRNSKAELFEFDVTGKKHRTLQGIRSCRSGTD